MMQLHKLCKHALELEWSGGRRGGVEVEGLGGGKRWVEKGKGGRTMTPHSTHGMKTPNCPTPMSNPWNKGLKLSNSHIQPMEQRPQTVQLPHPTHGTKTSNCPTPTSNPWNKDLKLSNSHIQPME